MHVITSDTLLEGPGTAHRPADLPSRATRHAEYGNTFEQRSYIRPKLTQTKRKLDCQIQLNYVKRFGKGNWDSFPVPVRARTLRHTATSWKSTRTRVPLIGVSFRSSAFIRATEISEARTHGPQVSACDGRNQPHSGDRQVAS